MSSDVVLSSALRSNLLSLQNTQRNIDSTQLRLATGLKVNSALDNPTSFFTAQGLNNRASDLTRLLDGIGQSIRTIEEADNGITALTNLVEQAQSIASEAQSEIRSAEGFASIRGTEDLSEITDLTASGSIADTNTFSVEIRTDDDTALTSADITISTGDTVYDVVAAINSDANIGTGNADGPSVRASVTSSGQLKIESLVDNASLRIQDGTNVADSIGLDGFASLGLSEYVSTENNGAVTGLGGTVTPSRTLTSDVSAVAADANGNRYASATLAEAGFVNGATAGGGDDIDIALDIDGTTTAIGSYNDDTTIQEVVDDINAANLDGVDSASFNESTGRIEIEFADSASRAELTYTSQGGAGVSFGFGAGTAGFDGATNDVALGAAEAVSENVTFAGNSVNLEQFQSDFNNVREQIDALVEDASFRGVNLLGGDDLTTFFNEDRSNSLTTEGADFTSTGLGIDEASFVTAGDIEQSISDVRNALESVRTFGTTLANDLSIIQTRRDFTEATINTLESGADDLTVADQNEEGANLLALQTRQQLGVTSLSLAAQSQQSVLRLF